jgi:hypothetical protein
VWKSVEVVGGEGLGESFGETVFGGHVGSLLLMVAMRLSVTVRARSAPGCTRFDSATETTLCRLAHHASVTSSTARSNFPSSDPARARAPEHSEPASHLRWRVVGREYELGRWWNIS